ncbi:N-6 DNA methylase [Leuconostoc kimchii]|nr:N-6 DNA methylase [Leuconostoc kimchii]
MMIKTASKTIHKIFGVKESFKLPDEMMKIVLDKEKRETAMMRYLDEYTRDLSYDGFHEYYEEEQAERKKNKQDFTPDSISDILSKIVGTSNSYYEPTAGTGGMLIRKWHQDQMATSPFDYKPSNYLFFAEELSDRALPFLIFNLAIRGINAAVIHGDVLTREARGVFFIQNDNDDFLGFSSVNVMPYSDEVKKYFGIQKWEGEKYEAHIESELNTYGIFDI